MKTTHSSFGEWLRARRKVLDLTQYELADRAGCAEDTIGRIEAGMRRPSKQVAALLAEALGVPPQSQDDFVRFAREGGATAMPALASEATAAPPADRPVPASHAASSTPFLSSVPQLLTHLVGRDSE